MKFQIKIEGHRVTVKLGELAYPFNAPENAKPASVGSEKMIRAAIREACGHWARTVGYEKEE